jgi:hypothetical protein
MNTFNTKRRKRVALTEDELRATIQTYLAGNFYFRKLEIDKWMDGGIRYAEKDIFNQTDLASDRKAEQLLEEGFFESWRTFTEKSVNYLCGEFLWQNLASLGAGKKKLIKTIIADLVEKTDLTVAIKSDPILESLIKTGRKRVKGIKPLPYSSNKRVAVDLQSGQTCFVCTDRSGPFISSPAYVLKKFENAYRIMFFTNVEDYGESKNLLVNQIICLTVQSNELGITPEQAVLQKW